jgi:hypothetical protein
MAPADDDPSTPARRDIQALYIEYQKTTDPIRRQQLLSEIYAGYLEGARDDILLLLCDALALTASFCKAPEAAKWLLLETAHKGGFPRYDWHSSNESLRGPSPRQREIDPRFWGKSAGCVHYPVDWKNSAVAYVRLEVSPYSPEGVILEQLGDFLPAEPYFQINLVRLPLRDVLKMLHRAGLLPDASRHDAGVVQDQIRGQTLSAAQRLRSLSDAEAAADNDVQAAAGSVTPPKVEREEWLYKYLTEERQVDLSRRHNKITSAASELHAKMMVDPAVEAYAHARNIERHPMVRKLFPPSRPSKKKKS